MSLSIAFHRAASAEFIEASAWYESKRPGLALEFMTEIDRCVSLASEQPLQFAIVTRTFGMSSPSVFRTAFVFVWSIIVLLFWRSFIAAETPLFDRLEPKRSMEVAA